MDFVHDTVRHQRRPLMHGSNNRLELGNTDRKVIIHEDKVKHIIMPHLVNRLRHTVINRAMIILSSHLQAPA